MILAMLWLVFGIIGVYVVLLEARKNKEIRVQDINLAVVYILSGPCILILLGVTWLQENEDKVVWRLK